MVTRDTTEQQIAPVETIISNVAGFNEHVSRAGKLAGRIVLGAAGVGAGMYFGLTTSSYEAQFAGISTEVTASVFNHEGLSVHTTLGDIEFPKLDGLPIGLRADPTAGPETIAAFGADIDKFKARAYQDFKQERWEIARHFGVRGLLGAGLGGLASAMTVEYLLVRKTDRDERLKKAAIATGSGVLAFTATVGYGAASFQPEQLKDTRSTGVLAQVDALRNTVTDLNARDASTKAINGGLSQINALLSIRDSITKPIEAKTAPASAVNILLISDMHLRNEYPFLGNVIKANDIGLIINTGDETEKGTSYDFKFDTGYVKSIAEITKDTPMVWVKGNHDSLEDTTAVMAKIPNVHVLDKQVLQAYGLWIAGIGDPRTYGDGTPALGDAEIKFEQGATEQVMNDPATTVNAKSIFDILMTHEQPAGQVIVDRLKGRVRLLANGHEHRQNAFDDLQNASGFINTIEGSTGMGGLLSKDRIPLSFSILKVAGNCQFVSETRYQLSDPSLTAAAGSVYGNNSSVTTFYFKQQDIVPNRACGNDQGIHASQSWTNELPSSEIVAEAGRNDSGIPQAKAAHLTSKQ